MQWVLSQTGLLRSLLEQKEKERKVIAQHVTKYRDYLIMSVYQDAYPLPTQFLPLSLLAHPVQGCSRAPAESDWGLLWEITPKHGFAVSFPESPLSETQIASVTTWVRSSTSRCSSSERRICHRVVCQQEEEEFRKIADFPSPWSKRYKRLGLGLCSIPVSETQSLDYKSWEL